jgi:hypothetical protein
MGPDGMTADDGTPTQPHDTHEAGSTVQAARRRSHRGNLLLGSLVLAAVAASAAASAALSEPAPVPVEQQLRDDIEGMLDAGLDEDHPKVDLVEDQLAAIEDGAGEPAQERGVDVEAMLEEAAGDADVAAATEARGAAPGARPATDEDLAWESGPVLCEPVPGLLSAEEIAGATCLSVPQPDGTNRYVAVAPDGVVHSVRFGNDGEVRRLEDTHAGGPVADGTTLAPTPEGDLRIAPPGRAAAAVDLP